ncbi:MAG: polyamine aminopropyltransferase [Propionibacteriaceae bacterium]
MDDVQTLGRSMEDGFEIALRRRGDGAQAVDELIVNGAFAMDSAETLSERVLAESVGPDPGSVLVGGLGLGYTVLALLEMGATNVDVVELSGALITWARQGLTGPLAQLVADPRVKLHHGDIADVLDAQAALPGLFGPWDAICLDVDNGPEFLIHAKNARVYAPHTLGSALDHLVPGGRLAIWSESPSKELWYDLLTLDGSATERLVPLKRGNRELDYAIYLVTKPR